MKPWRLHLGASSLELLARSATAEFIDPSWIHLGDPPNYEARSYTGSLKSRVRALAKRILRGSGAVAKDGDSTLYARTEFRPWMFGAGDRLDFPDASFSFTYSEHVLEHFRYDIAVDLLAELLRVSEPGGVVRTVVPDADYRTYEPPEGVGFPGRKLGMDHPNKHKMRWNVYLLSRTLEMVGFQAVPVVWCSEDGEFHQEIPARKACPAEPELVSTLRYVQRPRSLIVDGIRS